MDASDALLVTPIWLEEHVVVVHIYVEQIQVQASNAVDFSWIIIILVVILYYRSIK